MNETIKNIRNFSIIAHIDHGKSTLADRIIQSCGSLTKREMTEQILDSMEIERERGITIKAQCVNLTYKSNSQINYKFNMIDTPGHVDFSYEVSRSMLSCDGVILLVDASQGVEAQTVSNCHMSINQKLKIIPVINKIDLPQSNIQKVKNEMESMINIDSSSAISISAKTGAGINLLMEAIVKHIPHPTGSENKELQCLIIDSWFDNYLGVISLIKVINGKISIKDPITIISTDKSYLVNKIGVFTPKKIFKECLRAGEIGFMSAGIKDIYGAPVGDTITLKTNKNKISLPGFKKIQPKVYAGLFTASSSNYKNLKNALSKLKLNDSSLFYESENSDTLGYGFRCGFLGLLHMEIIQERLEREYQLELIITPPTVIFEITNKKNNIKEYISNPSKFPQLKNNFLIKEPVAIANIIMPEKYLGNIITLCTNKRGIQKEILYTGQQASITYELPINEIIHDFFDKLKSFSKGYASLNYKFLKYQESDLIKLDIIINNQKVDSLSLIMHKSLAYRKGKLIIEIMSKLIPRQMFEVNIQAAINSQIISRVTIKALRKNVTGKCYGGDITRKKKLLEKQKSGKKKMKSLGKIQIPKLAFLKALKTNE